MGRILLCVLLSIVTSAPVLRAQDQTPLASLAELSQEGTIPQLINAANALLAGNELAPADQAMVLIYRGRAYQELGEFTNATASFEKALAILEHDRQHQSDFAGTLALLATDYAQIGEIDTAKHLMLRSIHLFESESDHTEAAMIWSELATIAADQHLRREAHKAMARSLAESQLASRLSAGQLTAIATTQGRVAEMDGDFHFAIQNYQRAIDLENQTDQNQDETAWLYVLLGGAYMQAGDIVNAREATTRGLAQLEANSGRNTMRYHFAELTYSNILDASGAHNEASALRQEAQSALDTQRHHSESTISISAVH